MTGRRLVSRFALVALALALGGCGSYNPLRWMGLMSEPANKPTPLTEIRASVTPKAAWTASVGKSTGVWLRPDAEGGNVYATGTDGRLEVIEEATGRVSARHDLRKKVSSGVKAAEGKVIVGTIKGEVIAVDAAGKVLWSSDVQGELLSPAAVSGRTVVVRTADGRIFGLSLDDGKRQWVYQRQAPALLLRSPAGVMASGRDVVAGFPNGKLVALDLEDGKLVWEVTVATPRGTTDLERIADIGGLPLIDSGRICAAAFQGKVACFDIQSRNAVWSRDLSSASALVADAKNVYLVDDTGAVHALDKGSGASVWKQDKLLYRKLSSPVIVDGKVVVGDGFGYLHVLSPEDGALIGRLATDGSAIHALVPASSGLLVQTEKGAVVMVRF